MDTEALAKSVWNQIVTVWDAPVPFLAVAILLWWAIWQLVKREYATRIANADSTKDLLERQLQEYRDKLQGASPDEAKARLEALESQVRSIMPRRLTNEQRRRLLECLTGKPALIQIAMDMGVADARLFTGDLITTFESAGWTTSTPQVMGPSFHPPTGLGLQVADAKSLTADERVVAEALRQSGIDFDIRGGCVPISLPGRAMPVAELLVTARLN